MNNICYQISQRISNIDLSSNNYLIFGDTMFRNPYYLTFNQFRKRSPDIDPNMKIKDTVVFNDINANY
jgi:hypothetical protein